MSKERFNHLSSTRETIRKLETDKANAIEEIEFNKNTIIGIEEKVELKTRDFVLLSRKRSDGLGKANLQSELERLRMGSFNGMSAEQFSIENKQNIKIYETEIKNVGGAAAVAMILFFACLGVLIYFDFNRSIKQICSLITFIIFGIIIIWLVVKASFSQWKQFLSERIEGTSKFKKKRREEKKLMARLKLIEDIESDIESIPQKATAIESLKISIIDEEEKIVAAENKIIEADKQILKAWDSIKEMIPFSEHLKLE
jgi:hypothetical protein